MSHLYGHRGEEEEDGVEIEKFEVTEWDLANEFNPDRRRHRQTKEEATYGIWAEHDSDDERPSFGGKRYVVVDNVSAVKLLETLFTKLWMNIILFVI